MHRSPEVTVSPKVLTWARESAGFRAEEIAKNLRVNLETVRAWEAGEHRPNLRTLEALAARYKRPLAAFFLPEPPQDAPVPRDFRVLAGRRGASLSPETRFAIRRAHWLRTKAEGIAKDLGEDRVAKVGALESGGDPEKSAESERSRFAAPLEQPFEWGSAYQAFREWRARLEGLGVLVFQMRMPLEEARGFCIRAARFPVVVVNPADAIAARIFTLFHEYAHLALRTSGICLPDEGAPKAGEPVERFCNAFAGAFLVPRRALQQRLAREDVREPGAATQETLRGLAIAFKVSRDVILRRLLDAGLLSEARYGSIRDRWASEPRKPSETGRGFREQAPQRCLSERGATFVSLVLGAMDREVITGKDAVDYLALKANQIEALRPLVRA